MYMMRVMTVVRVYAFIVAGVHVLVLYCDSRTLGRSSKSPA
jgi:hypothetical protein